MSALYFYTTPRAERDALDAEWIDVRKAVDAALIAAIISPTFAALLELVRWVKCAHHARARWRRVFVDEVKRVQVHSTTPSTSA